MMTRRILGKKGRTTIPFPMRQILGVKPNDVIAYRLSDDNKSVIVTKEILCDGCTSDDEDITENDLIVFVESLPDNFKEIILNKLITELYSRKQGSNVRRVVL